MHHKCRLLSHAGKTACISDARTLLSSPRLRLLTHRLANNGGSTACRNSGVVFRGTLAALAVCAVRGAVALLRRRAGALSPTLRVPSEC